MNNKFNWRNVLYLLLLASAAILIISWWPELLQLWREHLVTFAIVTILMALGIVIQARNFITFIPIKHKIGVWSLSKVWAVGALVNYLGPFQPGIAVRVAYLNKNEVLLGASLLAIARQSIISIWVSFAGIAFGAWLHGDSKVRNLAIISGVIFLLIPLFRNLIIKTLILMTRPKLLLSKRELIIGAISNATSHGLWGVVAQYCIGAILLFIVYNRFGVNMDFGYALLMACAIYISSLIALVPGNFGVMEAIYIIGGQQLGMPTGDAIALAFLLRGAHIFSCFLISLLPVGKVK
jgi:uncharacterized membrane protein YbhN (UPF0104 family)